MPACIECTRSRRGAKTTTGLLAAALRRLIWGGAECKSQVGTDHLLLGLIVEENSKRGYLNTGLSAERARAAAAESTGGAGGGKPRGAASEVPFSAGSKRAFEQVCSRR